MNIPINILDKYIAKTIIHTTGIVILALMGLQIFVAFAGELGDVGRGEYGITQAMIYVVLDLPYQLYQLFPMIGLLGGVIGLGTLASHSELLVAQTAGVSILRISGSVLMAALLMIVVVTFLGEVVGPSAKHLAESRKSIEKSGGQTLKTDLGLWVRDGTHYFNIQTLLPGKRLEGISRYQFDDHHQLQRASFAKRAYYQDDHWVAEEITETAFGKNRVTSKTIPERTWNIKLNPSVLAVTGSDAEEMSLLKLLLYVKYLKDNGLEYEEFDLAFWQRFFQPIETVIMILLAIPFIFGPLRRVTMGLRITTGVIVGFTFYIANQFFGPFSLVYHFPPVLGAFIPLLIFSTVALYLLRRVRG